MTANRLRADGVRGRTAAFALCIDSTHQPRQRGVVSAVAGLRFVEQIIPCVFE